MREHGVQHQHTRRGRERELGELNHSPAVDSVGKRAAEKRRHEQRPELREPEQTDDERGAGQPVHLEGQRDVGDHRAEERDSPRGDEQPELAMAAQRPDVDQREPGETANARLRDRRLRPEPSSLMDWLVGAQRRLFSARSMSRFASRSTTARRLSRTSLPRASASSTFTRPSLK